MSTYIWFVLGGVTLIGAVAEIWLKRRLKRLIADRHPELLADLGGFRLMESRLPYAARRARFLWDLGNRTDIDPEIVTLGRLHKRVVMVYVAAVVAGMVLISLP